MREPASPQMHLNSAQSLVFARHYLWANPQYIIIIVKYHYSLLFPYLTWSFLSSSTPTDCLFVFPGGCHFPSLVGKLQCRLSPFSFCRRTTRVFV